MKQLYDINAAAQVLSISPWTIRNYIRKGSIQPLRIGRRVLLEEAELERFVSEARTDGESEHFDGKESEEND